MEKQANLQDPNTLEADLHRHYRRNFFAHCMDGTLFIAGINFISLNSIMPVFVNSLTDSRVLVGLLTTITMAGTSLPQLISANTATLYERKRDLVLARYGWGQRIPWLLMAMNAYFVIPRNPHLGLALFFVLYTSYAISSGLTIPVWFDVVVKSLPIEKRGRVLGIRYVFSGAASVLAGFFAGRILKVVPYPGNYSLLFFLAFAGTMASLPFFAMIWEPRQKARTERRSIKAYLQELPSLLARDKNYVTYLIANALIGLGGMAGAFYTVYAFDKLDLPVSSSGIFAAIILGSQTLSNLVWGPIADKRGYKLVLEIALLVSCAASLAACFASTQMAFYGVFVLFGIASGGSIFAGMNVVTELCNADDRPTYISLASTLNAPMTGISPLLGGLLAELIGYRSVFLTALLAVAAGFIVISTRVRTGVNR